MAMLVIKKHVRLEGCQYGGFIHAAHEEGFVYRDVPGAQRAYHALVRGGGACRDQGGS